MAVIRPQPAPNATELAVLALPRAERARAKAQLSRDAFVTARLPLSFTRSGYTITVTAAQVRADGAIEVVISATQAGLPVKINNPYIFVNPPIKVPDGTFHDEVDLISGRTFQVPNYVADPLAALQQIIADVLGVPR